MVALSIGSDVFAAQVGAETDRFPGNLFHVRREDKPRSGIGHIAPFRYAHNIFAAAHSRTARRNDNFFRRDQLGTGIAAAEETDSPEKQFSCNIHYYSIEMTFEFTALHQLLPNLPASIEYFVLSSSRLKEPT